MSAEFSRQAVEDAYREGRLAVARCRACGTPHAFPTPSCFACGAASLEVATHSGRGTVFSWVVNHHPFGETAQTVPYTVLLVELDGGARVYGNLVDDEASRALLRGGLPVGLDAAATRAAGHPCFRAEPDRAARSLAGEGVAPLSTAYALVRQVAAGSADKPAFELIGYQRLTYGELLARVDACAGRLKAEGVRAGDRVAVMSDNRAEMLELWLACNRIGAVFVPLNPALRGPILADMLALAGPLLAYCEPSCGERLAEAAPGLRTIALDALAEGRLTDWGREDPGRPAGDPDALTIIMFTSGTTGRSKGVMWSSMTVANMAASLAAAMRFEPSDRLHTALPMFHGNALVLSVFLALGIGATAFVSRKFSASRFGDELEACGATATSLLGSMTNMVLAKSPDRPFRGMLRKALVIPAPPATVRALSDRFGCRCASAYGLADAGLMLFSGLDYPEGTCGRAYEPLWEARIVDEAWQELPRGATGELAVRPRGPHVASLGYWRMPEATAQSRREGWIRTGDLMRQDEEGWFSFVDRAKDAIRRRGENVSSHELEQVFAMHPGVAECAAYPVPSEMAEDEIMLAVVRHPGQAIAAEELIRFAEPRLPYFALPRFIRFVDELPRNATEKVLKTELRAAGIVPGTFDLAASGYEVTR